MPAREFKPRIPKATELQVQNWAALAGAVVQPVVDDQNGWDCLIEFPPVAGKGPPDLAPPGLTVLVQVKSSIRPKKSCTISLSNALRLARHALPCFILLSAPDKHNRPAAYVRHVWDDTLADMLMRVREAHIAGVPLHRRRMTINFSETDRFDSDAVKQMALILDEIGPKYSSQKHTLCHTLGYEEFAGTGTLTFAEDVNPETLVDLALGLVESVPVSRFTYYDARFGLKAAVPDIDQEEGRVYMDPKPVADCKVTIRDPNSDSELNLPGQVFSPGIPRLPREYRKLRIKTSVLEVIWELGGKGKVSSNIDLESRRSLRELAEIVTAWSWASDGGLEIQIWSEGRLVAGGRIDMDPMDDGPHWQRFHRDISALATLAPEGRWPDDIGFSLRYLLEKAETLSKFRAYLQDDGMELSFICQGDIPHAQRVALPIYLELESYLFTAIMIRPVTSMNRVADTLKITLGAPLIRRGAILKGTLDDNMKFIHTNLRVCRDVHEPDVMLVAPPDFEHLDEGPAARP